MSNNLEKKGTYQTVTVDLLERLFENRANQDELVELFEKYRIDNYDRDEFISFFLAEFVKKKEDDDKNIDIVESFIEQLAKIKERYVKKRVGFFEPIEDNYIPSADSLKYRFFHPPVPSNPLLRFE